MISLLRQDVSDFTLVLACPEQGAPQLAYWGAVLPATTDLQALYLAQQMGVPQAMLDHPPALSLLPEAGRGWLQSPAVEVSSAVRASWAPCWQLQKVKELECGWTLELDDKLAGLALSLSVGLKASGVLRQQLTLTNLSEQPLQVQRLAMTLPVPPHFNERISFYGRWCQEFQQQRSPWWDGWLQENRRGRTSHDHFPGLIVGEQGFAEQQGEVIGMHLAWSGNHRLRADYTLEGHRYLQAEALYLPGEISLAAGESLTTPELLAAYSQQGLNTMSQIFHQEARARLQLNKPRPIHLNTWEAFYFDHDMERLKQLADAAAEVGVERYILDDGWFRGRDHDRAALGDWYVDAAKYPQGLHPLIEHVKSLGMEFGLWVEPEMVNPDSDLYRAHPDWTLQLPQYERVLGRNQLVLNLAHPDAYAYIRERLFSLLGEHAIDYLKWDMNRDYVQPGGTQAPQAHAQVQALYCLLAELRQAFPQVEIESCASGGARVDFGILNHTQRFWTSDCNDALERHSIQRGFSYFMPPEVMGAHIGPDQSHTTSRRHDLSFRAGTALLGHLGIEWNLLDADSQQRQTLSRWLQHYKDWRSVLHQGRNWRLPSADGCAQTSWALDAQAQRGLLVYAQLRMPKQAQPLPLRLPGLLMAQRYRIRLLEASPLPGHLMKQLPAWWQQDLILDGAALSQAGIRLPILDPESLLMLAVEAISTAGGA